GFPRGLQDGQALIDHQQFVANLLGEGRRLGTDCALHPVLDLGTLLLDRASGDDPDQGDQQDGDSRHAATGEQLIGADSAMGAVFDRHQLRWAVAPGGGAGAPPAALEAAAHAARAGATGQVVWSRARIAAGESWLVGWNGIESGSTGGELPTPRIPAWRTHRKNLPPGQERS